MADVARRARSAPEDVQGSGGPFRSADRPTLYVHPGQVLTSRTQVRLVTVLGSCVAVCLWDEVAAVGGLSHFVLPRGVGDGSIGLRFGNVAVPDLMARLFHLGAQQHRLRAKLFGGASVADAFRGRNPLATRNIETARALLAEEDIPVLAADVGGFRGRKLVFHPDDGSAWVKLV
jgi:chemotaxis protein CheD